MQVGAYLVVLQQGRREHPSACGESVHVSVQSCLDVCLRLRVLRR